MISAFSIAVLLALGGEDALSTEAPDATEGPSSARRGCGGQRLARVDDACAQARLIAEAHDS